ncbi:hypothetical protein PP940_gp199 [Rhizobium phage RL2RES]|uniref:Uncharacterized protein n=1 Tax=Rhizobium phage RL2RES TaxID=103371 RepID=A0A6B9JDH7_9CAUD|nr:hypothetical protein PP940_gp199 [Rhizobium phage RL2RES]QGZ14266.1 hypothetical protein RL2RES_199 [Rhizobium phage RL2RES]
MKIFSCYRYIPGFEYYGLPLAVFDNQDQAVAWRETNWQRFRTYVSTDEWDTVQIIKTKTDPEGDTCHSLLLRNNSYKNLKRSSSTYRIGTPYLPVG